MATLKIDSSFALKNSKGHCTNPREPRLLVKNKNKNNTQRYENNKYLLPPRIIWTHYIALHYKNIISATYTNNHLVHRGNINLLWVQNAQKHKRIFVVVVESAFAGRHEWGWVRYGSFTNISKTNTFTRRNHHFWDSVVRRQELSTVVRYNYTLWVIQLGRWWLFFMCLGETKSIHK